MIEVAFLNVGNADSIVVTKVASPAIVIDVPQPRKVKTWLKQQNCQSINAVFFTHNHRDHIPSLENLVVFLEDWVKQGTIRQVYLPTGYISSAIPSGSDPKSERMRDAMDRLLLLDKNAFHIIRAEKGHSNLESGQIKLQVLHPSFTFMELNKDNLECNEPCLVLRLDYGDFSVLLLADVEGKGLDELLSPSTMDQLQCNIMKVPHHGAWQNQNATNLKRLFDNADPEFAILSVGSTNQHKHVVPELFSELLHRYRNSKKRLARFVCTEVTRTCVYTKSERQELGKQGLSHRQPCAGDVIIQAQFNGSWKFKNAPEHDLQLQKVERPACLGKADL